jgi:ABC-type branched-subunit amino acid transport system ATPase component
MINVKNLTVKNFMSVGNATQAIDFNRRDLTLVLGENLDLGGDGSRNGTGKCVCINTIVKVKNASTGEIYETTMGELYNGIKSKQTRNSE